MWGGTARRKGTEWNSTSQTSVTHTVQSLPGTSFPSRTEVVRMPTSDERREVARAMQDWADRYPQGDFSWGVLGSVHYRIDGADTRPSSNQEVLYMLADLIDPTCEVMEVPDNDEFMVRVVSGFMCKRCGHEAIVERNCDGSAEPPRYCPCCGARVTGEGEG